MKIARMFLNPLVNDCFELVVNGLFFFDLEFIVIIILQGVNSRHTSNFTIQFFSFSRY